MAKKTKITIIALALALSLSACQSEKPETEDNKKNIELKIDDNKEATENKNTEVENKEDKTEKDLTNKENDKTEEQEVKKEEFKIVDIDYNEVKPNEIGSMFVIMYHGLTDLRPYHIPPEQFKKDLQYLYDHKYRPISMRDYIDNNIKVEAGYTPVVLTFDDGLPTAFSLVEEDGELKPAPNSAVAIMNEFAEKHPEFGKAATFYINGSDPFEGAGTMEQRFKYLIDNGYGIANHTNTHADLYKLGPKGLQEEIGKINNMIKAVLPDYEVDSLAYPFGNRPKSEANREFIKKGEYDGVQYANKIAFRVGYSAPYVAPNNKGFQPLNHPRLRGSEGQDWDLWFAFHYFDEAHPYMKYISDGNPNRIAVPKAKEDKVNKDSLNGKELYLY